MRLPKRGERGFTLIELLIVVAILGVLAAVVIPNITRFFGQGEAEARRTEFHNVSLAVASMMIDNGISSIPAPMAYDPAAEVATNQMGLTDITDPPDGTIDVGFPDYQSSTIFPAAPASPGKVTDPEGYPYATTDDPGYVLFGHDIYGDTNPKNGNPNVSYLNMATTVYFYTCESDGTVRQWDDAICTNEYTD
ncbi:hypothetical protein ES703_91564 [subsurface metagenome]